MQADNGIILAIDKLYRPSLQNVNIRHPKLIIFFSGPPSSGKTTIAKAIEDHFKALRLEDDSIRTLVSSLYPDSTLPEKSRITYQYMDYLRQELVDSPNGLWVIDSNIDVHHQKLFNFAETFGFSRLVFAMQIPEEQRRQWIIETGDRPFAPASRYLETMELRHGQQKEFLAHNAPDMFIQPDYNIEKIFELVDQKLKKL